jgi:hypothetical protein
VELFDIEKTVTLLIERGIFPENCAYKRLSGGTISHVGMILHHGEPQYVLKASRPELLAAEVHFLQSYAQIAAFPALRHVADDASYIVYDFVPGETKPGGMSKRSWLTELAATVISKYLAVPSMEKWGSLDAPHDTWSAFLTEMILDERSTIGDHLSEEDVQLLLTFAGQKSPQAGYLLHGDFGVHNFVFENGRLIGVIDPFPAIGEPIFDLVYAFCSTPDDLTVETLESVAAMLPNWQPQHAAHLHQEVLLGLYARLARCLRHHPDDLPQYLDAWKLWKSEWAERTTK